MKQRIEGHSNLYKDPETGVIVNRESTDRARYRLAKQQALRSIDQTVEIKEMKKELQELSSLKEEMAEIKSLLKQMINK
jgi:hypothetical protein